MSFDDLQEIFPIKKHCAYFMNAASGPLPLTTHKRICSFSESLLQEGSTTYESWLDAAENARLSAARLLDCEPDCIAFVKNTASGLAIAAGMLDWADGDELLLPRGEFPSNIFPWLALEPLGVKIRWMDSEDEAHPIPRVTPESVSRAITRKTRLLSVSWVQYDDGSRRDIEALSELCAEVGIVLVVDAIQGLGALPLSMSTCKADFVASGSQKWLLSPPGAGLLYVRPDWLGQRTVPNFGWLAVRDPFGKKPGSFAEAEAKLLPSARRFEEGTLNFPGVAALGTSIDLLMDFGIEEIAIRIKGLTDYLVDQLRQRHCVVVSRRDGNQWSGIVSFHHPLVDSGTLNRHFLDNKIITTVRTGWLRVAVHFFNDRGEIERLVQEIDACLAAASRK